MFMEAYFVAIVPVLVFVLAISRGHSLVINVHITLSDLNKQPGGTLVQWIQLHQPRGSEFNPLMPRALSEALFSQLPLRLLITWTQSS